MSGHRMPRLPVTPLMEQAARRVRICNEQVIGGPTDRPSLVRIADYLGTSSETLHRCLRDGVTYRLGDRFATALGLHPAELWGDLWWAGTALDPARN